MKKLAIRILSLCTCLFLLSVLIYNINPIQKPLPEESYFAAILDKERLLKEVPSPRILLVGGSNMTFGVDSKKISEEFKLPVVNSSLSAGLGLPFILNEAKTHIKKDDIIILSIEYYMGTGDYDVIKTICKLDPSFKNYCAESSIYKKIINETNISIENTFKKIARIQNTALFGKRRLDNDTIYLRKLFSENGDLISDLSMAPPPNFKNTPPWPSMDCENDINLLNNFYDFAKSKNASVYFLYTCFPITGYKKNESTIKYLQNQYTEKLKIPILNTPKTFLYPDDYFFDTMYHLKEKGKKMRTETMIQILKPIISIKK